MHTLNDEWLTEQILILVKEEGKALGYSLVLYDAGACMGKPATWCVEKNGYYYEIPLEELYRDYSHESIRRWLHKPYLPIHCSIVPGGTGKSSFLI